MKVEREYGLDLLRILSMMMVIMLHLTEKSGFISQHNIVGVEAWILYCFSTVAVNCFVLITGYFMSYKHFSLRRVLNIWIEAVVYSILTYIVCCAIGKGEWSVIEFVHMLMPFTFKTYWFVNIYILLLFLSPIINIAIQNMTEKQYKLALFALVSLWCVINNGLKFFNPIDSSDGYGIEWFVILYMTGAYIRRYKKPSDRRIKDLILYLACSITLFLLHTVLVQFGQFVSVNMIVAYNDIFVYIGSVALFAFFSEIKITNQWICRIISYFASTAFAVYLIHHAPAMRLWIYDFIENNNKIFSNGCFLFVAFMSVAGIYIVSSLIAHAKMLVFRVFKIENLINKVSDYVESHIRRIVS